MQNKETHKPAIQVSLRRKAKACRIFLDGRSIIPDGRTRSTSTLEKNKCGTYTLTVKKKEIAIKRF
jgi:hypothetical protein